MRDSEVVEYIESVKDPEKFLSYCKKYYEGEPRDIAYVVSRSIISKDPANKSFILASAKIIIITWNVMRLLRLSKDVRANLENDILQAYKKTQRGLEKLEGKKLEHLDLNNSEMRESIKSIFLEFSSKVL